MYEQKNVRIVYINIKTDKFKNDVIITKRGNKSQFMINKWELIYVTQLNNLIKPEHRNLNGVHTAHRNNYATDATFYVQSNPLT